MKWCPFVLRVVAMAFVFAVTVFAYCFADRAQHNVELVERERVARAGEINHANIARYELELVMQRNIGFGVMFLGGLLFVWSCVGLVKRGSSTRKAGVIAVSIMGAVVCYAVSQVCVFHVRRTSVLAEHGDRIKATAELKTAQILFERGDWPRPYTNIVRHLEKALVGPTDGEAWAHGVLADCYLCGRGCGRDIEKSRQHAEIAAQNGDIRGKAVLERLDKGDTELPQDPEKAIFDVTGVDVTAVQMNPRRGFAPPKMTDLFRSATAYADGDGRVKRVSFAGHFEKGTDFTNGLERIAKLLPDLCRRLDCEEYYVDSSAGDRRWWILRFTQTSEWIATVRLYHGRTKTGEQGPLYVTLDVHGREPDGRYNGANCRFERKPLTLGGVSR